MAEKLNNMVSVSVLDNGKGIVKDFVVDYCNTSMYLCDAIQEWADTSVDIYCYDIDKYLAENVEKVQDAIDELGWEGVGCDIRKAAQMAQLLDIENDLQCQEEEIWKQIAFEYLEDIYKEIPVELIEAIEGWACDFNNGDRIDDMIDNIDDWFADHEEEEEEEDE